MVPLIQHRPDLPHPQICRRSAANHSNRALPPGARVPQRQTNHFAAALFRRHNRLDAQLLRIPAHAVGRRLRHHLLHTGVRRDLRPSLPKGTVRHFQRHHRSADADRRTADHATAARLRQRHCQSGRPRPGAGGEYRSVGTGGRPVVHALWCQCVRSAARAQRSPLLRHYDEFRWIRIGLHLPGQLVAGRTLLAALRHRTLAGRRPGTVQLPRPDPVDAVAANGASRSGGDCPIGGHCVRVYLAGVVLQGDSECVFSTRCDSGGQLSGADGSPKVGIRIAA